MRHDSFIWDMTHLCETRLTVTCLIHICVPHTARARARKMRGNMTDFIWHASCTYVSHSKGTGTKKAREPVRAALFSCVSFIWPNSFDMSVSVCCSVLQCVAVCCSVLQCVAVCCSVLQCVAVTQFIWHASFMCVCHTEGVHWRKKRGN